MSERAGDVYQWAHERACEAWEKLRQEHKTEPFFLDVLRIFTEHDPMGIARLGSATNPYWQTEYEPEARAITPRLTYVQSFGDVQRITHEAMVRLFALDPALPITAFDEIASDVWNMVQQST